MKKFGHTFHPMKEPDWDCFAGAEEDSLICYCDDEETILIWSPKDNSLSVITNGEEEIWNKELT